MGGVEEGPWSHSEAVILTMVSTHNGALPLAPLLLRMDSFEAPSELTVFADAMGRLVAAGLVVWLDNRFSITAAGRELSPGGAGRYFKDLFEETRGGLNERVPRPNPVELGISEDEFARAVAAVGAAKDQRRTRRGYFGPQKWAEWHDAPPLDFGDCLEFLTFAEGRDVVVLIEASGEPVRIEGKLGLLTSDPSTDAGIALFPVVPVTGDPVPLALKLEHFQTASYNSYDGCDYFSLRMEFDDDTRISVSDANAPTF